jgi:hypothetical protein
MTDSTYSHQSIRPCVAMEDFHQRIALPLDLPTPSRADVCRPHRDDVLDHPHRGTGSIPPSVSRGVFPESSVQRGTGSATPKSRRPPPPSDLARWRGSWSQRRAHHLPRPPTTSRAEQSKGRGAPWPWPDGGWIGEPARGGSGTPRRPSAVVPSGDGRKGGRAPPATHQGGGAASCPLLLLRARGDELRRV